MMTESVFSFVEYCLFGKKVEPTEQVRKWRRELQRENRKLDRSIFDIQVAEKKIQQEVKFLAKRGDTKSIYPLGKELVRSKRAREKILEGKTRLNSLSMQLQSNLAAIKIAGCMEKSSQVLQNMNVLIRMPQVSESMREMAKEMKQAGLIDEMIQDTIDMTMDEEDEEGNDEKINQLVYELTGISTVKPIESSTLPLIPKSPVQAKQKEFVVDEGQEEDIQTMRKRLQAL